MPPMILPASSTTKSLGAHDAINQNYFVGNGPSDTDAHIIKANLRGTSQKVQHHREKHHQQERHN
jgi:hypothetical protein